MRRGDTGCDDVRELGLVTRHDGHGRDDAGELHLELHVAVEVEVPVEPVLVVADGRDEADDEPARPPRHVGPAALVDVLPEDPVVLLVQTDRALDGVRLALLGGEHDVEVVDDAETVASLVQRVRTPTESPLAGVERVLPPVHRPRVPVRHDHLAHRRAVEHRTSAIAVVVVERERVQHQPFVRVEADAERPRSPADVVAVDHVTRAVGLGDLERPDVGTRGTDVVGEVRPSLGRQRHHAEVDHLQHLAGAVVEEREQPFDRARVAVVGIGLAQVRDAAADPAPLLVRDAERARGPRVDLHDRVLGDAAPPQRGPPVGVLGHAEDRLERLAEEQRGPHPVVYVPGAHVAARDRHHDLDRLETTAGRHEEHLQLAVHGRRVGRTVALRRFAQPDVHEHRPVLEARVGARDRRGEADLSAGDQVERVRGRGGHERWSNATLIAPDSSWVASAVNASRQSSSVNVCVSIFRRSTRPESARSR